MSKPITPQNSVARFPALAAEAPPPAVPPRRASLHTDQNPQAPSLGSGRSISDLTKSSPSPTAHQRPLPPTPANQLLFPIALTPSRQLIAKKLAERPSAPTSAAQGAVVQEFRESLSPRSESAPTSPALRRILTGSTARPQSHRGDPSSTPQTQAPTPDVRSRSMSAPAMSEEQASFFISSFAQAVSQIELQTRSILENLRKKREGAKNGALAKIVHALTTDSDALRNNLHIVVQAISNPKISGPKVEEGVHSVLAQLSNLLAEPGFKTDPTLPSELKTLCASITAGQTLHTMIQNGASETAIKEYLYTGCPMTQLNLPRLTQVLEYFARTPNLNNPTGMQSTLHFIRLTDHLHSLAGKMATGQEIPADKFAQCALELRDFIGSQEKEIAKARLFNLKDALTGLEHAYTAACEAGLTYEVGELMVSLTPHIVERQRTQLQNIAQEFVNTEEIFYKTAKKVAEDLEKLPTMLKALPSDLSPIFSKICTHTISEIQNSLPLIQAILQPLVGANEDLVERIIETFIRMDQAPAKRAFTPQRIAYLTALNSFTKVVETDTLNYIVEDLMTNFTHNNALLYLSATNTIIYTQRISKLPLLITGMLTRVDHLIKSLEKMEGAERECEKRKAQRAQLAFIGEGLDTFIRTAALGEPLASLTEAEKSTVLALLATKKAKANAAAAAAGSASPRK